MSREQNTGKYQNIKIGNNAFESVELSKYLRTTITNQYHILQEIQANWAEAIVAVNSVQILLSSSLLFKSKMIEIYRTVIVRVVLCECETWPFTLKEDHGISVFENMLLREIFGLKKGELRGKWRRSENDELDDLYCSPNIIRVIKTRRMRWVGPVARTGWGQVHTGSRGRGGDLREGHHLVNRGVDGRLIVKQMKKWYREVGSGLIRLWIRECGGCFWMW